MDEIVKVVKMEFFNGFFLIGIGDVKEKNKILYLSKVCRKII